VPFAFGTYERDAQGEYNAAAFVEPGRGLLGFYRKTRLFPFTEHVPAWLDSPALRSLLPWTGHWRPGNGARPMPLRLANGREVPVLPLICLDDMDTGLAVDGTRLGAQVILTMSNDAWFGTAPLGAQLHLAAAAMRSVETRLPQFRVTNNGYSAVIDAQGNVLNETRMGERTLVIGEVPVREPPRTLIVAWGPWVGPFAALMLALLVVGSTLSGWVRRQSMALPEPGDTGAFTAEVALLPPAARIAAGALRAIASLSLLAMAALMLFGDGGLLAKPLAQIRWFIALVLVPELAAWMVMRAFSARAALESGALVLARGAYTLKLPLADIATVQAWRSPLPAPGATVRMASGARHALVGADAIALRAAMGMPADQPPPADRYAHAALAVRAEHHRLAWLAHPLTRFALLPFLIAVPAFRLHQHIAYGSTFGEWQTFGAQAWLTGFALWWAGWAIAIAIVAAVLRVLIEAATLVTLRLQPAAALPSRRMFERIGMALLFLGPPAWLLARVLLG
jgi:apolipoprotein N-acyltransferase